MTFSAHDQQALYYGAPRLELQPFLPQQYSRVLEIGCGRGGFRSSLHATAEVWGVEPVAVAAEIAKAKLDRVFVGTFAEVEFQLPGASFDLIICNDVIEHIADDVGFLQALLTKIKPGGYLMGSVPNMRNLPVFEALIFSKQWDYKDDGVLDRTHLRFYTVKSFPALLKRTGFEVIKFAGINRKMRPSSILWRLVIWTPWLQDTRWQQFAFLARTMP
jgi:SAM-dependent methyltransferase